MQQDVGGEVQRLEEHLDRVARDLRGDRATEPDLVHLRRSLEAVAGMFEDGLRQATPALHFGFDDENGVPALVVTPTLNVRFGGEIERFSCLDRASMDLPEVRRTVGARAAAFCDGLFALSDLARRAGCQGLTEIRELPAGETGELLQFLREEEPEPAP